VRAVPAAAVIELTPVRAAASASVPVVKLRLLERITDETAFRVFPYRRLDAVVLDKVKPDVIVADPPTAKFWSIVRLEVIPREIGMVVCPCVMS
jgi:hypothetical protein